MFQTFLRFPRSTTNTIQSGSGRKLAFLLKYFFQLFINIFKVSNLKRRVLLCRSWSKTMRSHISNPSRTCVSTPATFSSWQLMASMSECSMQYRLYSTPPLLCIFIMRWINFPYFPKSFTKSSPGIEFIQHNSRFCYLFQRTLFKTIKATENSQVDFSV